MTKIDGTALTTTSTVGADTLPLYWESTVKDFLYIHYSGGYLYSVETSGGLVDYYTSEQESYPYRLRVPGVKTILNSPADISSLPGFEGFVYSVQNNIVQKSKISSDPVVTLPTNMVGGLRVTTTKDVEGFTLTLSIPRLYSLNNHTGYGPASVSLGIYHRPYYVPGTTTLNTTGLWVCYDSNYTVSDSSTSEIIKTIEVYPLVLARREILIIRTSKDNSGNRDITDDVYLKELTEINSTSLKYNHTALLGVKIRATDQLSGQLPTITCLVKGLKVAVPDNCVKDITVPLDPETDYTYVENTTVGTKTLVKPVVGATVTKPGYSRDYTTNWGGGLHATKVWTDNPVWCLYDLLTNARYGLADYYKIADNKRGMMLANFYLMAKYCDEMIPYTDDLGQPQTRPRFTLNIVIDQSKSAAEWVTTIASIMRASLFYNEGIFWIDIDRPKYTSQIFNMSSIKEFTQAGTSYRAIPNTYEVQWVNPDIGYEMDVFRVEDEDVQLNQHIEERKKALMLVGVTNFDQAKSLAKFALLAGKYRTKVISFKTGTQGLRSMIADVIGVQHDVPQWGWGGKIANVVDLLNGTYRVTLSSPLSYNATFGEMKMVATPTDTNMAMLRGLSPVTIDVLAPTVNGDITELIILSAYVEQDGTTPGSYTPTIGDSYLLSLATNTVSTFKITNIKRDTDEIVEINAVEYDPQIYAQADDASTLGAWAARSYSLLDNPVRSSVNSVTATVRYYQDSAGLWKTAVDISYESPKDSFWRGAELHYNVNRGTDFISVPGIDTTGKFVLTDITMAGEYQFVVTSVYAKGKQLLSDAMTDTNSRPWVYETVTSYIPNDAFLGGVTGLAIENRANDGTFKGRDCVITWRAPLAIDAAISDTAGDVAGGTSNNEWLRDYSLEIKSIDGTPRRTVPKIIDTKYIYTHEMNFADAVDGDADRRFTATVVAYDRLGRKSAPKTIECYNPAPPVIS